MGVDINSTLWVLMKMITFIYFRFDSCTCMGFIVCDLIINAQIASRLHGFYISCIESSRVLSGNTIYIIVLRSEMNRAIDEPISAKHCD